MLHLICRYSDGDLSVTVIPDWFHAWRLFRANCAYVCNAETSLMFGDFPLAHWRRS